MNDYWSRKVERELYARVVATPIPGISPAKVQRLQEKRILKSTPGEAIDHSLKTYLVKRARRLEIPSTPRAPIKPPKSRVLKVKAPDYTSEKPKLISARGRRTRKLGRNSNVKRYDSVMSMAAQHALSD